MLLQLTVPPYNLEKVPVYCSVIREHSGCVQGSVKDTSISCGVVGITLYQQCHLMTNTFHLFTVLPGLNSS